MTLRFAHLSPGSYRLEIHRTGFQKNDPQSTWIEMGKPTTLSAPQLAKLQSLTRDLAERSSIVRVTRGDFSLTLPMRSYDAVLVTMERLQR